MTKEKIFEEIAVERVRQEIKWGEQNHPITNNRVLLGFMSEDSAKNFCDTAALSKELTWGHILIEEVAEALHAPNKELMRKELIQCGAVIVAMIESLDRNGK